MKSRRWHGTCRVAAAALVVAAAAAACSPGASPGGEPSPSGTAVIEVPSPGVTATTDPSSTHSPAPDQPEAHNHAEMAGDAADTPSPEELEQISETAADFFVAMHTLHWDSHEGVKQWLDEIETYATPGFHQNLVDFLARVDGGQAWADFAGSRYTQVAGVDDASFAPYLAFTDSAVQVWVYGAVRQNLPNQDGDPLELGTPRTTLMVLARSDDGTWLVDGLPEMFPVPGQYDHPGSD